MDRPERDKEIRLPYALRLVILLIVPFLLASCASVPRAQERVRCAAESGDYAAAVKQLESSRKDFGKRSELLFLMEKGYLLHLEGSYRESCEVFEQAKRRYDELYTKSISGLASSFIFTDYSSDYRGEDFERVLINVFQALNYVMLGDYEEARVEARDADSKLAVINSRYPETQKNVYREDAFCRLLMGLLYEASRHPQDADDACLWFRQALDTYEKDYRVNYGTQPPAFLVKKAASCPPSVPLEKRPAEVYVIQYSGFSPLKQEVMVPVPLLNGYTTSLAFPRYYTRPGRIGASRLTARASDGSEAVAGAECGEDIGAIAVKNLEDRQARAVAKAALKAAGKYLLAESQENAVYKRNGAGMVDFYRFLSSIYFLSTNRADLRSWQTLPEKIMIARLPLAPGTYSLDFASIDSGGALVQKNDLGTVDLAPGEKRFFIVRSPY